ncbi:MAG: hypothetical protein IMZ46_13055, partial [Acidobacteria bacterium]|nr:hypothetical protein [Acidobacteriota bacterium]
SRAVGSSYKALRDVVERHEPTIQRRWANKTRQQKLKVLLSAWPSMARIHRPDFHAFRKESADQRRAGTKYRESYMWPYINQEDLAKPRPLLHLLNSRARNPPPNFARADLEAMNLGIVSLANYPIILSSYTMMLNGVTDASKYGKLIKWTYADGNVDLILSNKQFLPGDGLFVLEAQERLLAFLVHCCHLILHDIPEDALVSDTYPRQLEPQLNPETEEGFDSLAIMAANAPYRVPAKLDLARIESLLAARVAAAEDHLWALREDPGYFAEELLDVRDHRQELLKDTLNAQHAILKTGRESLLWARVIGKILTEATLMLEIFSSLHQSSRDLVALAAKYSGAIVHGEDLPEEYLYALLDFRNVLQQTSKFPLGQLKHIAMSSPPMRRFFFRLPPPEGGEMGKVEINQRMAVKTSRVESEAIWLLTLLWEDGHPLFQFRLPLVVDELERLVQAEPEARELLSPRVASTIADVSIWSQCLAQLELYQPWAASFDQVFRKREDEFQDAYIARREPWVRMMDALGQQNLGAAVALGTPTEGKFTYPVKKRRTKETVQALRRAEGNLDVFWSVIDRLLHSKAGTLDGSAMGRLLLQPRELQRTPVWVEPAKDDSARKPPGADPDVLVKPFSELFFGLEPATTPLASPKAKVKTRGTPSQDTSEPTDASASEENEADAQPVLAVDARALKVLRTVFFNPDVTSTPGTVAWGDFLHAMKSTGFAAEKLYGSVWQFRSMALDAERGIQFHEPHPSGRLPFNVARRYGRRLNRAYGWFGGMFVLKEKENSG